MTRVLVWKNGNPREWEEITFKEFVQLRRTEEGKGRYFSFLSKDICTDADNILIECTKEQYEKYAAADRHAEYLRRLMFEGKTVHMEGNLEAEFTLLDRLPDETQNVEAEAIKEASLKELAWALKQLTAEERELILKIYNAEYHSMTEIAKEYGVSNSAIGQRKKKIEKKLKNLLHIS